MVNKECSFPMVFLFFSALFALTVLPAGAAEFPARPVTYLVGYPPGGQADAAVRILANVGQKYLGQPITVESKLGASGQICADYLARQKPDGHTVGHLTYSQTHGEYFSHFRDATSTSKDFRVVAQYMLNIPVVVVRADDAFNTLKDLVEYTKKNPGLTYAPGGGKGNLFHVSMAIFAEKVGIQLVDVPTKGEGEIVPQLLGGHLRVGVGNISTFIPFLKAGKVKALGLIADDRYADYPAVPTFKEQGYDIGMGGSYQAAHVPAKTPDSVVAKLRDVIKKTCQDPEFISGMKPLGAPVAYLDGEAMEKRVNDITSLVVRVFKQFGYIK